MYLAGNKSLLLKSSIHCRIVNNCILNGSNIKIQIKSIDWNNSVNKKLKTENGKRKKEKRETWSSDAEPKFSPLALLRRYESHRSLNTTFAYHSEASIEISRSWWPWCSIDLESS